MGNVTGTLIENAFQHSQTSNQPPVDIQEEIKRLARGSSNRELYRLLHAEMEHGAKERISIAQSGPITETAKEAADVKGVVAEKLESTRFSSDNFHHAQGSSASWKYRDDLLQTIELSQSRDRGQCSGQYGNGEVANSSNGRPLDGGVTKVVSDQEESCSALRMAFKKKILNSYRTENEEPANVDDSTVASRGKRMRTEEPTVESAGKNVAENGPKAVTKVLNFDNCIQVIVMNELQKLETAPDDLPSAKKLELFGKLGGGSSRDSQKNRSSEGDRNKVSRDRGSVESGWPSKTEKTAGQSASFEPNRDKLSPYGCMESAGQNPADASAHRARARKVEVGQGVPSARSAPSAYRAVGHHLEAPEVPRMYPPSLGDGPARNSRQMGGQQSEVAEGKVSAHYLPTQFAKYSHPGVWGHSQEPPAVQPSPHLLLADPGYRMTSSNQMAQPMMDHRRRVDKDPESVRLPRPEYISYSGSSQQQHPLIPSQPSQRSSYQNSPPVMPDNKHHRMDIASYLYPAKAASHDRIHNQYETSCLNQPEGLHPPTMMSYLKHSPKNSPHLAYDKEPVHPVGEPQYGRTELLKASPGCAPLAGSVRNYRTATETSNTGYRGERIGRPDPQLDKRTYGMHNGEVLEFEKYIRSPAAGNNQDVPAGSDQRSFSASFLPRGRDGLDRGVAGPTEESPLDLTTKRDVRIGHHGSVYLVPSGAKQHQPDWEMAKSIGYRPPYVREENPVHANMFRPASQKASDFVVSEQVGRRDVLDGRQAYEKAPHGLTTMQPDSNYARLIPTPVQERNMRVSVVASHPFDDAASSLGPPSHLLMQQISEALMKSQQQPVNNWKPVAYQEVLPQSNALALEPEPSFRGGGPERTRPRPGNPGGGDLLHLTTTSPTIPHLSPIQPLVAPGGGGGGRRVSGPSLLGSHSPSDILHLQCKVCGSTYGSLRSFRMHFAKVHGLEPLPEHCSVSTISGTKNAMSKVISVDDNEPPPALQREPLPSDIGGSGRSRSSFAFDQFSNGSRPSKPDALNSDVLPVTGRTEQVAQVYPMPASVAHGLSPQLKVDPVVRRPSSNGTQMEPTEAKTKMANDAKNGGRVVNCDLGIIRSRNCYSDVGCDVDCPECLDGFKDISDWKMHISTHMMRSCSCKACSLSFTHSGALKRHLQTVHVPTEKVDVEFRCLFCREVFSDEKVLFQHTQEHEKKYSRVENTRRESGSSQNYKQHDGSVDSDGIQMAIPDTTSSDDVRPTSGFRENSSNISTSTDSKGSSYDRRSSFADLLASGSSNVEPDNFRRFGDARIEDENASYRAAGVMGQSGKMTGQSKSPGSALVAQSELSDAEKDVRTSRASEESVAFVSKKQAFLKRFKSSEERESADSNASSLSAQPGSNGALYSGRPGTVLVLADNADVQQPMHLRDLFSIMSHQVEKSIRSIPDFPPVTSFVPAQRSRCVRDVCDEIIAQSFRKDRSPKDGLSSASVLEGFEPGSNDNAKEPFKSAANVELDSQMPDVQRLRSGAEVNSGAQVGGGWVASPCSSRDSYHSLEIDESQFDKERPPLDDPTEAGRLKCADADRRSPNCDLSPRPEPEQRGANDLPERRKCDSRDDSFRALESEIGGVRPSERYFNRREKPEDSESCAGHAVSTNSKESCSPSSTQKLDVCGKNDVSTDTSTGHGLKRKRSTSDVSETGVAGGDNDPAREKILRH